MTKEPKPGVEELADTSHKPLAGAVGSEPRRSRRAQRTVIDPGAAEQAHRQAKNSPVATDETVAMDDRDADFAPPPATGKPTPFSGSSAATKAQWIESGLEETPEGDDLHAGQRISQYELISELGKGGMGRVFLARDTVLGRKVAIKFLQRASKTLTDRFLIEARATARCSHDNIVVIFEANAWKGLPYMVLEYLDGDPLSSVLKEGRVPAARAVELAIPIVRALIRAHEFSFVHRDLKPDNIFVLRSGVVKVLDFGIAKFFAEEEQAASAPLLRPLEGDGDTGLTRDGALVGTLTYMAPEQWGVDTVDHRTDIWALGLILHEMVTGTHPLAELTSQELLASAGELTEPLPRLRDTGTDLPSRLTGLIDRCLEKKKEDRFDSASALLEELEKLQPSRVDRSISEEVGPYPGLTPFQEADAARFFGRSRDVLRVSALLREQPLLAVVGPSGVGKSSFVRAGVVPALKSSGEDWEVLVTRPGRHPLAALASAIEPLVAQDEEDSTVEVDAPTDLAQRLAEEPGYLGRLLRARARRTSRSILLFVDQFEELYTLVPDADARAAFTRCLTAVADDPGTPLRVLLSMRSDLLDRAAEDPAFLNEITRGLVFLPAPSRAGLEEALTRPLDPLGFAFESPDLVTTMLDELTHTAGALPLLQFTASKLWETRDQNEKQLTRKSYDALGGVAGALATHATDVLTAQAPSAQRLTRTIFQRLVTSEGTRAIVDLAELAELGGDATEVQQVVAYLVDARLLVVQTGDDDTRTVELVHESLIHSWPTLRHWLDESREDAAYLEQLRNAARQWDTRDRPVGLLWRDEALEEARRWHTRYTGTVPGREERFLEAAFAMASRAARRRRTAVIGAFLFLLLLIAASAVALISIRHAERNARTQANVARRAKDRIKAQLDVIQKKESERLRAEAATHRAEVKVAKGRAALKDAQLARKMTYQELQKAYQKARESQRLTEIARKQAEAASAKARAETQKAKTAAEEIRKLAKATKEAKTRVEKLLAIERARVRKLEALRKKMATGLK